MNRHTNLASVMTGEVTVYGLVLFEADGQMNAAFLPGVLDLI